MDTIELIASIIEDSKSLEPKYSQFVDENFWDLV